MAEPTAAAPAVAGLDDGADRPGRFERFVARRPPRAALAVVVALVLATGACSALPGAATAATAPAALAAVLAPLWFGWGRTALVLLGLVVVLQPLPPERPTTSSLAAATAAVLGLALVAGVVRGCLTGLVHARTSTQRQRAAREHVTRNAVQQEQELAGQLHYWATHDALTRTLDRTAFSQLVGATMASGVPTGVLVVSVAGFTGVNETYGQQAGDAVLVVLGQRLVAGSRGSDAAARLGGDVFAVLLPGLDLGDAVPVAQRLAEAAQEPVSVGEHVVAVRLRAGVAVATAADGVDPVELVRRAESAVRAGTPGRPPKLWAGTTTPVDDSAAEADLSRGLAAGELFLLYQPLVSTRTGRVQSVEALVRWRHPERGLVPPDAFIGLAERTGLIVPLGLQVLEMACDQLRAWAGTAPDLTVAVNVSARQLVEDDFVEDVRRIIWGAGINPAQLVLELTESLLVEDSEAAVAALWQLRGLGVRLALDDFGTGYSSLARLGELPLDEMKIDKSFVDRLGVQPNDSTSLLTAAVAMGHGLGLEVVAEGIEKTSQALFLRDVGCDLLQGYLFSRPQSPADLAPLLGCQLLASADAVPGPRQAERVVLEPAYVVPAVMPPARPRDRA